ncbi:hypothetical protein ACPZ19_26710 [Amycolatopsis lurida]
MTHTKEEETLNPQPPTGGFSAPDPRAQADAADDEPAPGLEPTIVLGRE